MMDSVPEAFGEGAEGPSPAMPPYLSFSRLSKYADCSEAYRLQYVEIHPQTRTGAACAGTAVHSVIEEMLVEGWWDDVEQVEERGTERVLAEFDKELIEAEAIFERDDDGAIVSVEGVRWGGKQQKVLDEATGEELKSPVLDCKQAHPDEVVYHDPQCPVFFKNGNQKMKFVMANENYWYFRRMMPTWVKRAGLVIRRDRENGITYLQSGIERKVVAWLDGPGSIQLVGYIDSMLLVDENGESMICDWKTGWWMKKQQLANYAWMLAHTIDESGEAIPTRGRFVKLRATKAEDLVVEFDLGDLVKEVQRDFRDMVKGLEAGIYMRNPGSFCGSCFVAEHCAYGKLALADKGVS